MPDPVANLLDTPRQIKESTMKTVTNDNTMRESVERELEWDAKLDATRVAVSAKDGAIVLSGHVPTHADKWEAVKATERGLRCQSGR
jgi:osmotically-inducible protein OsmY